MEQGEKVDGSEREERDEWCARWGRKALETRAVETKEARAWRNI